MTLQAWFEKSTSRSWTRWPIAGAWWVDAAPSRVEEPPFVPFDLSALRTEARARRPVVAAAEPPRPPATLAELGVPAELAHDLEVVFQAMGATAGGQVKGFRFHRPDGSSHPVRLDDAA